MRDQQHGTGMDRKAMIRKCLFTKRDDDTIKKQLKNKKTACKTNGTVLI